MGMGMAMAQGLTQIMGAASRSRRPTPPRPTPRWRHVWHIAVNGEDQGAVLQGRSGAHWQLGRADAPTHVWTQGQDGWKVRQ